MDQSQILSALSEVSNYLLERRRPVEVMARVCQRAAELTGAGLVVGLVVQEATSVGFLVGLEGLSRAEVLSVSLLNDAFSGEGLSESGTLALDSPLAKSVEEYADIPENHVLYYGKADVISGVSVIMVMFFPQTSQDKVLLDFTVALARVVSLGIRETSLVSRLKDQTRRVRRPSSSGQVLELDVLTRYKELFAVS